MTEHPSAPPPSPDTGPDAKTHHAEARLILCPYCGATQHGGHRCKSCGGLFEPLSRMATQIAMGPWQIRDRANPFKPGFSYPVLAKMIAAGKVKPTTVLRGPTTHQFWSLARNVPGVAHLLGYCHGCGKHVQPTDPICEACGAEFKAAPDRNRLGLRFKNQAEVEKAQQELDALVHKKSAGQHPQSRPEQASVDRGARGPAVTAPPPESPPELPPASPLKPPPDPDPGSDDLLRDVLGLSAHQDLPASSVLPPQGQAVTGLDFTPQGADAEAEPAVPAAHAVSNAAASPRRIRVATWALIVLNALALAAVAVLAYGWMRAG